MPYGLGHNAWNGRLDQISQAIVVIEGEENKIHEGKHFTLASFTTLATSGTVYDIGVTTPDNSEWTHFTYEYEGTGVTELYFYENAVFTGGSAVTPVNNNRNSTNTSNVAVVTGPTVSNTGTLLLSQRLGSAGNPTNVRGGENERVHEIILKTNTKYLVRFITRTDANVISYQANWYEHTNKINPF